MRIPRKTHWPSFAIVLCLLLFGCDSAEDSDETFFVSFQKQVLINETGSQLACGGTPEFTLGQPTYTATFPPVNDALRYTGRIQLKDDTFASEMPLTNLSDEGNGNLKYSVGVGSISVFLTCSQTEANTEQQNRLNQLDDTGHQGVEITPVFE